MNWIKCSDSLPPAEQSRGSGFRGFSAPVLACSTRGQVYAMQCDSDESRWYCAQGDGWGVDSDITHWMPMPSPPAESERRAVAACLYHEED